MKEYPSGCVVERADGSYEIKPRMPQGRLDAQTLDKVNDVVRLYGLPGVRATAAQRLVLEGVPAEHVDAVVGHVNGVGEECPSMVTLCPGGGSCKRGLQSTRDMARKLETLLNALGPMPAMIKCGLSGCPRCCGESFVRDVGLMGSARGWAVLFGGNAGRNVRAGDELIADAPEAEALAVIRAVLEYYAANAKARERTARFVERVGIDAVGAVIDTLPAK
ncbi:nitrite reductase [Salidesulfovibrio onnuriiensis]|uniref:nitrite reductase n=1 Tax=Salidesulfovibrio onnuriiensis TaxID=2583823 RepID=UPI00202BA484|nr:nitrite reductase [Salidesulfovibrio onnuriiensis]